MSNTPRRSKRGGTKSMARYLGNVRPNHTLSATTYNRVVVGVATLHSRGTRSRVFRRVRAVKKNKFQRLVRLRSPSSLVTPRLV